MKTPAISDQKSAVKILRFKYTAGNKMRFRTERKTWNAMTRSRNLRTA